MSLATVKTGWVKLVLVSLALVGSVCLSGQQVVAQTDTEQASVTMELVREGSYHYIKRDYKRAIPPYQKALDREKVKRLIDRSMWIVLVDNLGMAYGISGELEKAKETFEYGISKDAEYPLFYYNMACTYAEMDNLDRTIEYLKLAFERKDKMLPGEQFPDPATDSSFQRFMRNEKFLQTLRDLKKK